MNKTANYEFTIIVPVYNELDNMEALEKRLGGYLPTAKMKSCVLFVDDGSTDGSRERLVEMCRRNPDFYYVAFERNSGKSAALKAGFDEAESEYVGYIDADLQTTPEDFNVLMDHAKDYELVMGIRADRKDTAFKKFQSKIGNGFRRMMTHDGVQDTNCPLTVMRTSYAKRMPFFTGMHRFVPALMLLQGCRIMQIPVRCFPRTAGQSKYNLWNRLVSPLMDCFAYRWMKKRYINYHIKEDNLQG